MENENSQEKYFQIYSQKQESLLLDFIRKNFDLEIRCSVLTASLNDLNQKHNELQGQLELQSKTIEQATAGLEALTYERKTVEDVEKEYDAKSDRLLKDLNKANGEKSQLSIENKKLKEEIESHKKLAEDFKQEFEHCKEELNSLNKEFEEFKKSSKK